MCPSKRKLLYQKKAKVARAGLEKARETITDLTADLDDGLEQDNPPMEVEGPNNLPICEPEYNLVAGGSGGMNPPIPIHFEPARGASLLSVSQLEPAEPHTLNKHRPPTIQESKTALWKVNDAIHTRQPKGGYTYHDLDHTTRAHFDAMRACLSNFIQSGGKYFLTESLRAARAQEKRATYA
ncbi:unnamed protein product [Rhizoctonia solani]|uniref:Uncharacterized protein n=1 Tax=Rhizoctonia solani TaxID=456999 RepID=A0A8H3BK51_9AGAM|nr:unnamed protein product [Rhizoctonia solani]